MASFSTFQVMSGRDAGRWRCICQTKDQFGRPRPKTIQRGTKEEAEREMKRWLKDHGRLIPSPLMSVAAMCEAYVERCKVLGRKPKTIEAYEKILTRNVRPTIGHIAINRLTPADVEAMLETVGGGAHKQRTRSFVRAAINRIGRKADPALPNVASIAEPPRHVPKARRRMTAESLAKVLAAEQSPVLKALWLLLAETGLRPDEARRLMWTELIRRKDGWWVQLSDAKTAKGRQPIPVPLSATLFEGLAGDHLYVFPQDHKRAKGKPYGERNLAKLWKSAVDLANVPYASLYSLRHLFGTRMAARVPQEILRELLRHSDVRTSLQYYVEPFPEDLRKAVDG